jgi:hypothetical protein
MRFTLRLNDWLWLLVRVCAQANVAEARSAQQMALAQDSEKQVFFPLAVHTLDSDVVLVVH